MRKFPFAAIVTSCALVLLTGCSKKGEDAPEAAAAAPGAPAAAAHKGADQIPGESEYRAAVADKNYSLAVERLMGMQALLASPEQRDHWSGLYGELRTTLMDASDKDAKAAEALMQLRTARNGR